MILILRATVYQWRSQEFDWGGVYVSTTVIAISKLVPVPHVNRTVTDFWGIYTDIPPPVATPLHII